MAAVNRKERRPHRARWRPVPSPPPDPLQRSRTALAPNRQAQRQDRVLPPTSKPDRSTSIMARPTPIDLSPAGNQPEREADRQRTVRRVKGGPLHLLRVAPEALRPALHPPAQRRPADPPPRPGRLALLPGSRMTGPAAGSTAWRWRTAAAHLRRPHLEDPHRQGCLWTRLSGALDGRWQGPLRHLWKQGAGRQP